MLLKQNKQVIKNIIFTSLLALLTSCGNSNALESFVGADPELLNNNGKQVSQQAGANQGKPSTANDALLSDNTQNQPADNKAKVSESQGESTKSQSSGLPSNFPKSFPLYPQAQLKEANRENETSGRLTWDSPDRSKAIADYYEAKLAANDWKIIKPFNLNPQLETAKAIAVKNDLRVDLTLVRSQNKANPNGTEISVIYQPIEANIGRGNSPGINYEDKLSQTKPEAKPQQQTNSSNQEPKAKTQSQPSDTSDTKSFNLSGVNFQDLDQAPEQLRQPLESVAALDILTPYTGDGNIELSKFAPNKIITRGEYAHWLITANNRYFQDSSDKKIYLASTTNEPAFQDVKPNNPDFEAIQSLAEAGLIPSRLTEDSNNVLFKPDAPLTREDLLAWKVPLDMRQSLPKASIEAIKESWGFQDAGKIDSTAIRALYADFQNGDRSNVRRIFGYTTLFQPQKPVTRAEAAASLWYFGFQGDGVTAKEILETESKS